MDCMANPIKLIELAFKAAEMSLIRGKKFNNLIPEFCVGPISTKKKWELGFTSERSLSGANVTLSLSTDRQSH